MTQTPDELAGQIICDWPYKHRKDYLMALLTDWERETRLDEAKWWEHLVTTDDEGPCGPDCMYCKRIAELSRPAEKGKHEKG